jgi:ubiquitin related modifier 1
VNFNRSSSTPDALTQYSGGLEMLFDNEMKHEIKIPSKSLDGSTVTVAFLIKYLCEHLMRDSRKELFVLDGAM